MILNALAIFLSKFKAFRKFTVGRNFVFWQLSRLSLHSFSDGQNYSSILRSWAAEFLVVILGFTFCFNAYAVKGAQKSGQDFDPIDRSYHGFYEAERVQVQEIILSKLLRGLKPATGEPEITFLTGPLASGKTTLAKNFKSGANTLHIDIDRIRAMLPEFERLNAIDPKRAVSETQKESGYIAELLLWRALKLGLNVIYETSLRQTFYMSNLKPKIYAYAPKYRGQFNMIFVFADLPSLFEKADLRNQAQGRFTPADDVKERYFTSMDNFFKIKGIFDHVIAIDNSKNVQRWVYYEEAAKQSEDSVANERESSTQLVTNASIQRESKARYQQGLSVPISNLQSLSFEYLKRMQAVRPENKGYDLFLDLDWTLFYPLKDPAECEPDKLIQFGDEYYRALDHIEWFFSELKSLEGMRIRIVTGASEDRAHFLLSKVVIQSGAFKGKSLLDLTSSVSSYKDLLQTSLDMNRPFTDRVGKYIQKLFPDIDMTRALLMDDQAGFSRFGLNVLDSFGRLNFRLQYSDHRSDQKYEAPNFEIFNFERGRLRPLLQVIVEGYHRDRSGLSRFSDIRLADPWPQSSQLLFKPAAILEHLSCSAIF